MLLESLLGIGGKLIDKLIPDPAAKAQAQLELAKMAQDGELARMANETDLFKTEQNNVTDRWKADAATNSWLAVNIRPMSLIAIFVAYFIFTTASAFGYNANEAYVTLLGNWGILIFGAYFGSRSIEKIIDSKSRNEK